jgi:hypothetical protein
VSQTSRSAYLTQRPVECAAAGRGDTGALRSVFYETALRGRVVLWHLQLEEPLRGIGWEWMGEREIAVGIECAGCHGRPRRNRGRDIARGQNIIHPIGQGTYPSKRDVAATYSDVCELRRGRTDIDQPFDDRIVSASYLRAESIAIRRVHAKSRQKRYRSTLLFFFWQKCDFQTFLPFTKFVQQTRR